MHKPSQKALLLRRPGRPPLDLQEQPLPASAAPVDRNGIIFSRFRIAIFPWCVCSFSVMMHGGIAVVQAAVRKHLIKKSAFQPEKKAAEGGEEERRPGRMNAA
ncbi:unnamed protein product [Tenebrio molitor]|nr:unnamed protein product [Tenebrio molitor]